eukprot:TRINITY_DN10090_c0_g1_i1.p1 TRINITY_DN10090_c0_g1~~TRINITY_DN10090_c0_g1_i1.p1  ORF type:complete len:77 (+),score=7.29 TRINITY_DN10090_c0_g1_i1:215-445(+)
MVLTILPERVQWFLRTDHDILQRPIFVCSNSKGHLSISDQGGLDVKFAMSHGCWDLCVFMGQGVAGASKKSASFKG